MKWMGGVVLEQMNLLASKAEIIEWVASRRSMVKTSIVKCSLSELPDWSCGAQIHHKTGKFFQIKGFKGSIETFSDIRPFEAPLISQPEVGFLGILEADFHGERYFLLQAKIEPGNANIVEISPTVQATRSNLMRVHGGSKPLLIDYFLNATDSLIVFDQLLSEQGFRFFSKLNRNMVRRVKLFDCPTPDFAWVSEKALKDALWIDNLVNMDTRSVFSSIVANSGTRFDPRVFQRSVSLMQELASYRSSVFKVGTVVSLQELADWSYEDGAYSSCGADYKIEGVEVTISNREVVNWCQPMIVATAAYRYTLFLRRLANGGVEFLCELSIQFGLSSSVELGPTISSQSNYGFSKRKAYLKHLQEIAIQLRARPSVSKSVNQSEEGGRFFHDSNINEIIDITGSEYEQLEPDEGFAWVEKDVLGMLMNFGSYANIELRSLISLL